MKGKQPSIRQIEYFIHVAKASNFRKAAEKLGMSQPTLTSQIAALEEALGTQLFERSRAGTLLSPAGRELLPIARRMVEEYQQLLDYAETSARELVGTFKLGVSPTIGPYLLPRVLPELHRRYNRLRLHLREGATQALEKGLDEGDFDLILTVLPMNSSENKVRPLFVEPIEILVSSDHALAPKRDISGRDLINQDVLTIDEHHHLHRQIENLCEQFGAKILRDYEGTSLDTLRQMVLMGMGIAFLPSLYVRSEIRDGDNLTLLQLREQKITRSHVAAWRRNSSARHIFQKISFDIKSIAMESYGDILEEIKTDE
jgi:LysR family transcriptional regulator, hydrogen peroxide-inducible genes activator